MIIGISALAVGCGQKNSGGGTTTTTETITLSGTLNTGTISSANVAAASYRVVAVDNSTEQIYHAATNSSGVFTLSEPPIQAVDMKTL